MSMMGQPGWEQQAYATMGQELDGLASPEEVNYREAEDPEVSCGECLNFMPPDACSVVAGKVNAAAVCDAFAPREDETLEEGAEAYE